MAELFSFPLRVMPNGRVATVELGSDADRLEQLTQLVLTRSAERPLSGFGITDPAFVGFDAGELAAAVDVFGPDGVARVDVDVEVLDDTREAVTIRFD